MMGVTHFKIGAATWLGLCAALNATHAPPLGLLAITAGTAIAAVSALEPDIDSKGSLASKMFGPITKGISFVVRELFGGHRKITHSLLGMAIVAAVIYPLTHYLHGPIWIPASIMTGWISHVAADMLTREGCPLLWPISKKKYGLHFVRTGLDKKNGHHTSEYWVVRPFAILALIVFPILLFLGM